MGACTKVSAMNRSGTRTPGAALSALAALLVACADDGGRSRSEVAAREPCAADPLAAIEVAPADRVEIRYAQNFRVTYRDGAKRVTVANPWRGADLTLPFLLVPCDGAGPLPAATSGADTMVIPIPPRRVVTSSTTQLPNFVALDLVDRLVGHNGFAYVGSEPIRERIESGAMTEVGDGVRLNPEVLIELDPDLVIASSIGNPELDVLGMLREAHLPFALDASYMETTPLGRAEWIKFTALFFNREREAVRLFRNIARRYEALARLGRSAEDRPTVLVGTPFQGTWHVSGGAAYQARLIADAGGDYLWSDDPSTGAIPLDFESVYARGLAADVWLHPYGWHSLEDGLRADPRMADFAAFRTGQVYNNDRRARPGGGNDYWETGSLRPDLILADLIRILHPELLPEHRLVFHRRLEMR